MLEGLDDSPERRQIDGAFLTLQEFTNRRLQLCEGGFPFPRHEK